MNPSSLEPGALVAERYRLERLLGEGGMGTVWEATHTVTRRSVAMKFLKEALLDKPLLRKRFLREAATASALKHPNVVEVLDVFDLSERVSVLVMEYLDGETLGAKLKRDERLSVEETAALMLPVISAVGAAHALGIVHRDLKPENIFLVQDGDRVSVKVLDFGIAKVVTDSMAGANPSLQTDTGAMLGTPCYMAPEQATGEGLLDHRADIWSLGVILYECLSGSRPIEGDNLAQVVMRLISAGIVPLARVAPELPPDLSAAVMQMLTRDAARRSPNLLEISKLLGRYTRTPAPSFQAPGTQPHTPVPTPQSRAPIAKPLLNETKSETLASTPAAPSSLTIDLPVTKQHLPRWVIAALFLGSVALIWTLLGTLKESTTSPTVAPAQQPLAAQPAAHAAAAAATVAPAAVSAIQDPIAVTSSSARPRTTARPPKSGKAAPAAAKTKPAATPASTPASPRHDEQTLFGGRK